MRLLAVLRLDVSPGRRRGGSRRFAGVVRDVTVVIGVLARHANPDARAGA